MQGCEDVRIRTQEAVNRVMINAAPKSHIAIKQPELCGEICEDKPCTCYCPTGVFIWAEGEANGRGRIKIDHRRCVECLACPFGCPHGNIHWEYPPGGYGVEYRY